MKKFLMFKFESMALVLLGFGLLFLHFSDRLKFFILPFYDPFVVTSGLVLILLGVLSWKSRHNGKVPKFSIVGVLFLSLIMFFVPPRPLSERSAQARGSSSETAILKVEIPRFGVSPENRSIIDWTQMFNFDPDPHAYLGQAVKVDGFIQRSVDLPEDYFLITRFTLSCCIADARPVSLIVHANGVDPYMEGTWWELKGKMNVLELDGEERSVVELTEASPISTPDDPYTYQ
jgi:uncharacterized repeat protein (TIGR03943 family)